MKKLTLFLLLLFTVAALSAKSDKPRDWKQLISLLNQAENVQYCYHPFGFSSFRESKQIVKDIKNNTLNPYDILAVSLKTLKPEQLNDIERNLLLKYSDVAVKRNVAFQAYFTIDEEDRIGAVSLTGEELYPPIEGAVMLSLHLDIILMGVPEDSWGLISEELREDIKNNTKYNVAFPIYKCSGAIKFSSKGAEAVIPYGEYDYCYMTRNFSGSYFYVCRNEGDKELWGVYDKSGKQLVECNYKSVEFRKGKFIGHNDMTMDDVMESYLVQIEKKEYQAQIRAMIANIMLPVGVGLVNIGSAMQQSQSGSSSAGISTGGSSSKASGGGVDYLAQYRRWERIAEQHYNSITNLGASVKYDDGTKSGSAGQSMSSANYVSMKKSYREAQQEMARIRRKAAQAGVSIPQSPWETNTISY